MILNAYSVLAAFLAAVQLLLGIAVTAAGVAALRGPRHDDAEARFYLPFLLATVLVAVAAVSWPLLFLLLQSWVPEWPGVMCIQGVTRVGENGFGPERWLPRLLDALQWTKPLLAFLTGAWLLLHLANRRTRTGPLTRRVLLAMVAAGVVAAADATAEGAYLFIPKQESSFASGCCTIAEAGSPPAPDSGFPHATEAFFGLLALVGGGAAYGMRRPTRARAAPVAAGALLTLLVGAVFLRDELSPRVRGTPLHRCAYCLLADAPWTLLGVALLVLGAFAAGWALLVPSRRLFALSLFGHFGAGLYAASAMLVA